MIFNWILGWCFCDDFFPGSSAVRTFFVYKKISEIMTLLTNINDILMCCRSVFDSITDYIQSVFS